MNSIRLLDRRAGYIVAAFVMLLAAFVPALVSAAQVTERSIELSSASANAQNVSYTVNFTPAGDAQAYVIDFCANSPLIGQTCSAPAGFDATSSSNYTAGAADDANTVVRTGALTGGDPFSIQLTGIHNPTTAGPLYARIVTFPADTDAGAYTSATPGVNAVDNGSVALSITPTIGVSGAVLESLTFCVANAIITANCANASANLPTIKLGQDVGGVIALNSNAVYEGTIYSQISTNAATGAIVSLKSSALNCGGLVRAGAPTTCDITPALVGQNITAGQAKFGVKLAAAGYATSGVTTAEGTLQKYSTSIYDSSAFAMNYVSGNATGVTSVYGDPILDTNELPANNQNMDLTFGASVSNTTPAGLYSADLSLIATGKF